MRNLKKILALVLALMMVLSVMVTASAADFTDAEEINYKEAVEVMAAAGVLAGNPNADGTFTFDPAGTLTRAGAAKLIAYVELGDKIDEIVKGETQFSDVPASNWASGFVNYCAAQGYIVGYNGAFNPNDTIDGYGFAKLLLMVLGYEGEYTGGNYKLNVSIDAKEAELTAGLAKTFKLSDPLTREAAAQMAFNAMKQGVKVVTGAAHYAVTVGEETVKFATAAEAYFYAESNNATVTYVPEQSYINNILRGFGIQAGTPGTDSFGRPEKIEWVNTKNQPVYTEYQIPLAIVTDGTFDATKTGEDEAWEGWTFPATDKIIYNGSTFEGTYADLKAPGMTVELYGTVNLDGTVTVSSVIAYEYYFATITNINATTGAITVVVEEAGAVINEREMTVTVSAAKNPVTGLQSADYLALSKYEKGTVLALCLKQAWNPDDVNYTPWGTKILDVQVPTAVEGIVTGSSIAMVGDIPSYSRSYVMFNGTKYSFSSQYNRAPIDAAAEGTLYLLNDLAIGFVPTETPDAATDVVYVVDHFVVYVEGTDDVYDTYGKLVEEGDPDMWLIYAQGVNLDGEVVNYLVDYSVTEVATDDLEVYGTEKTVKLFTATATGFYDVSEYAYATQIDIAEDGISYADGDTKYYYTGAEYVHVVGALSDVKVGKGANADLNDVWVVFGRTTSANKTVSKVFTWAADVVAPAPEHMFLNLGLTTTPLKTLLVDAEGKPVKEAGQNVYVYTYSVLEGAEVKTITSYESALALDYYEYYVDEYGVCVVSELDGVVALVTNVYGNYVSAVNVETETVYTDYDITGITIVDLTEADEANEDAGNGAIDKDEVVVFYAVPNVLGGYDIDCIYIIPVPAA